MKTLLSWHFIFKKGWIVFVWIIPPGGHQAAKVNSQMISNLQNPAILHTTHFPPQMWSLQVIKCTSRPKCRKTLQQAESRRCCKVIIEMAGSHAVVHVQVTTGKAWGSFCRVTLFYLVCYFSPVNFQQFLLKQIQVGFFSPNICDQLSNP